MNKNKRNKPGPSLSLTGFFSGSTSTARGGRDSTTISPAQLKPTRIIDSSPPSGAEVVNAFENVPVAAVVRRHETSSSPLEETASSTSENATSQPIPLEPLKYTITFPPSSSSTTTTTATKQALNDLLKDITNDPNASCVEIQCARPKEAGPSALSDAEWQQLGDLVDAISGFRGVSGGIVEGGEKVDRRIVICELILIRSATTVHSRTQPTNEPTNDPDKRTAGLLPPPLDPSAPFSQLHTSRAYADVYLPRLTELSLNASVSLMLCPPVVDAVLCGKHEGERGRAWWAEEDELRRVMRLYMTPAMECFGSHRIIFGSSSPPVFACSTALITPERWYAVAKTVVAELVCGSGDVGEAQAEMDDVFAGNAGRIWGARTTTGGGVL
ncbi:hypothetical protein QFC21_006283 [Naganishia friedmannii]|uniref:Uncharacterized protein n=1 Tax=Naganishia friedmannii TaxID=89922 RepID=A0ACC2V3U1_9TREE|nr:hypothetical protein QFC21_006283 [Naganishia friedmannii]